MGNTACGGKRGVVNKTLTCGGARNMTQVVTCVGGRSEEDEESIKLFTAPGKDSPRTYDPLTYTESIEGSFSPVNQALFLLASPYHYDRVVGAMLVDTLSDEDFVLHRASPTSVTSVTSVGIVLGGRAGHL